MDHVELNSYVGSERIQRPLEADVPKEAQEQQSKRFELGLILSHMEKKYGVRISEIRERDEVGYLISISGKSRKAEVKTLFIGKYSNEHMMRSFARYLNKGRLSRKNVDETIYEMKSLRECCS